MTWTKKIRVNPGAALVAEYECPDSDHGRFTLTVQRDANGDPPEEALCPAPPNDVCMACGALEGEVCDPWCTRCRTCCGKPSPWRPSAVRGRVKLGEVDQGKVMDYPPPNVCLDTRPLADDPSPGGYERWKTKQRSLTRDENIAARRGKTGRTGKVFG